MKHLAWLWIENDTRICFGSILMILESIKDFTKKTPSLVSFMSSINVNDSFRVESNVNGLMNKVWEVREILTQEQWKLGHPYASYAFLSQHMSLLASHLYYPLPSTPNVLLDQPSVLNVIFNQITLNALELYS